jgi:hypothetical protein
VGGLQRLKLKDWRLDIMKVLTAKREESFMLNFRNTSAPAYPRDLEQLIYDVAEYQRDTTRHDAAIIDDGYVEMNWCDFLAMVLKLDDSVYGALLQGEVSWIGMDRERTRYILGLA